MDAHVRPAEADDAGDGPPQRRRRACRPRPSAATAVNAAELAWPDGNDDVCGRRTGYRGSPSAVGRGRWNSRLTPWLTSRLSAPSASASTGTWLRPALAREAPGHVGDAATRGCSRRGASPTRTRRRRRGCRGSARGRCRPSGRSGRSPGRAPSAPGPRRPAAGPPARRRIPRASGRRRPRLGHVVTNDRCEQQRRLDGSLVGVAAEARAPRLEAARRAQRAGVRAEVLGEARPLDRLPHGLGARGDEAHGLLGRRGLDRLARAQVHQPDRRRPAAEHLLAQERVEVHAGEALLLPVRRLGARPVL